MKATTTLAGLAAAAALVTGGVLIAEMNEGGTTSAQPAAQQTSRTSERTGRTAQETDPATPNHSPTQQSSAGWSDQALSADEAAAVAVRHVGGGRAVDIEREFEHGRSEWEVEVVKSGREIEVRVDASTGTVTRVERDDRDDRFDDRDDRFQDEYDDRDDRHGDDDRHDDHDNDQDDDDNDRDDD